MNSNNSRKHFLFNAKNRVTINLIIFLIFTGCTYKFPTPYRGAQPTSVMPYDRSNITDLPYNDFQKKTFVVKGYKGIKDSRVLGYKLPEDTVVEEYFKKHMVEKPYKYNPAELYPGTVWVSTNLLLDEMEIANIHWQEFLFYIKRDSSEAYAERMSPKKESLPFDDYFDNPFYRFYPVVGISYEQVIEFCKWRTDITNRSLNKYFALIKLEKEKRFKIIYRLPTEKEWETFAACGINLDQFPHGVKYTKAKARVLPHASKYYKEKNKLPESISEIRKSIRKFNKEKKEVIMFHVKKDVPYFMYPKTPSYVFDLPINNYGLYHMIGNVSELVSEKGITKGGSYLNELGLCKISLQGKYEAPAPDIGFRCICEIIK